MGAEAGATGVRIGRSRILGEGILALRGWGIGITGRIPPRGHLCTKMKSRRRSSGRSKALDLPRRGTAAHDLEELEELHECPGRDSNPRRAIENLKQDRWLPSIALLFLSPNSVCDHPVPSLSI